MGSLIQFIRSGGQSGVDRAALDTASKFKIAICGWVPKNGWAEDMTEAPGLLAVYPNLRETPSHDVNQRTNWNARDSHVTLIFDSYKDTVSKGTKYTIECLKYYQRPYFLFSGINTKEVIEFLKSIGFGLTVNIAGARESEQPGIYDAACDALVRLFNAL